MMTDISKEAVERLAQSLDHWRETPNEGDPMLDALLCDTVPAADTMRAQAARIEQLEAALATARDDALREVFVDVKTFAPHEEHNTGPEHDIGYASGYHTALHRIADLINKEQKP